jgi:hypothetical protein
MKHQRTVLILSAMCLASSCSAPKDQSIVVSQARAPGLACDFSDATKYVEGGAVDLAAFGPASSYYQVFGWENDLEDISVSVSGSQITTDTPNTFIATTIQDVYQLVGAATSPPTGFVSISATIPPGGTSTQNSVGVYLLTQEAAQAICGPSTLTDNCPGVGGTSQTLLVTFQIMGTLVGGGGTSTNPITYPITLFNSGNTMPGTGGQLVEPWVCATGQPQTTACNVPGRDITYCP